MLDGNERIVIEMPVDRVGDLRQIRSFPSLVVYLRDELDWPIERSDFEDLTFDYTPEELGIDSANAAKIQEIKRLRPLSKGQPWGIFFVKFEPKQLPVVALRRILNQVVLRKRASANSSERSAWATDDLLFISDYGDRGQRQISFAHFSQDQAQGGLPILKVLGWDSENTQLHLENVAATLHEKLVWPADSQNHDQWRETWRSAFSLRHREVITTSRVLAERLAELARAIRARVAATLEIETEDGPVTQLMSAFKSALIHDLEADDFADMYAQTIAYGLLSARISDPRADSADHVTEHMRTNPFLKELLETFLSGGERKEKKSSLVSLDFDELGISEVVALLDAANMEAVLRDFGDRNPREDPVIHFYEYFLREYDPKKRLQRGVFYTPQPVVSYLVRSVDEVLRGQFGLENGLADTATWAEVIDRNPGLEVPSGTSLDEAFVQILDPATGTGTFLVEVIDLIYRRLTDKWLSDGLTGGERDDLWQDYVCIHLLPRLHGYELLVAPYAIAHLKVGLKLRETGYRFENEQRAQIYLTNSLAPATDSSSLLAGVVPALAHEAASVNSVKERKRFTVLIGNPPYSKISANLTSDVRSMVDRYRYVGGVKIKEKGALQFEMNLQDDYVKFVRLCEQLCEAAGAGVVGVITNSGYLSTPTLRGMRDSLLESFATLWVFDLHGHLAKGESGPDGGSEENVFDIIQGVSLLVAAKHGQHERGELAHYEAYGLRSYKYDLLEKHTVFSIDFNAVEPTAPFYLFVPQDAELKVEWQAYDSLQELFLKNSAGIITARDGLVLSENARELSDRMRRFSQSTKLDAGIYSEFGFSASKRFDLHQAQLELRRLSSFEPFIRTVLYRPFDERWIFYHPAVVWSMSRPISKQMEGGDNLALIATRQVTRKQFEHAFVSHQMIEIKACSHDRNTQIFPLYLRDTGEGLLSPQEGISNIKTSLLSLVSERIGLPLRLDLTGESPEYLTPRSFFNYLYAILHAASYRSRYFEFLRSDFPRIPRPGTLAVFRELSTLGARLVCVHLLELEEEDSALVKYKGPECPRVDRFGWSDETIWLDALEAKKGQIAVPGTIGFSGVSEDVWNFHIGGYHVCHKWLKDRKGQTLSSGQVLHYRQIIAAITQTLSLMKQVDAAIETNGGWPNAFRSDNAS